HGDGLPHAERVPDRQNDITDLNLRGIAQRQRGSAWLLNLENSQIGLGVGSHDAGREFRLIVQRDFDIGTTVDDVIVRDDEAVRRNDDSRTETALLPLAWNKRLPEVIAEKSSQNGIAKKLFSAASVGCDLA